MTSINRERKVNPTLNKAYQPKKIRQAMHKAERHEVMDAYVEYTMNNKADDGRKGKSFEVEFRRYINPNTITLKCQKQTYNDCTAKANGKRLNIECKTGGGEIAGNLHDFTDWKNQFNPHEHIKFDFIAYCFEYKGRESDLLEDTIVMTKEAFIYWCEQWEKGLTSWLTYKSGEGRIMIANPRAGSKNGKQGPREKYARNIWDTMAGLDGVYTVEEFKEWLGK